jgi:hypothetical protein
VDWRRSLKFSGLTLTDLAGAIIAQDSLAQNFA